MVHLDLRFGFHDSRRTGRLRWWLPLSGISTVHCDFRFYCDIVFLPVSGCPTGTHSLVRGLAFNHQVLYRVRGRQTVCTPCQISSHSSQPLTYSLITTFVFLVLVLLVEEVIPYLNHPLGNFVYERQSSD